MLENLKLTAQKVLDSVVSVKVGTILITTALLCFEKVDQSTWMQTVLIVLGFRTINEVTSMVKAKNVADE